MEGSFGTVSFEAKKRPAPAKESASVEQKKPRFERALAEEDAKHVRRGLEALYEEFETVPEEDFPDVVIFMDTGARPLAAGVLPIVRAVAKERGLPEPDNRFLAGSSRPFYAREIHEARESGDPDWKEKFIEERIRNEKEWRARAIADDLKRRDMLALEDDSYFSGVGRDKQTVLESIDQNIKKYQEALAHADELIPAEMQQIIQEIEGNERALSERVKQILSESKAKHVTIVDDYLSGGLTMKQLLKAFKSVDKASRPHVTFMSFFAKEVSMYTSTWEKPEYELNAEQDKKAWVDEGFEVLLPTKEESAYAGFAYQFKPDYGKNEDFKKADFKKGFIGVEKVPGQAISKVSPDRDVELMLQLRHEIRDISEKILKKRRK